ncbi:MAG: glycosyltransferase family 2 protein [Bacteroidales bacterium]|nr:glycosyltransferase family 2 protein [Bacteroidales bacterium]
MKTLVIIVTYNAMRWVDKCIGSVNASSAPADVFVADNASTDGTADYISKKYPDVHLVRNEANLGFAEGNNQGFRYALEGGYDYVYLLNQDAWIMPDTLEALIRIHSAHKDYAILSPDQMQADGQSYNPVFLRDVVPCEVPESESEPGLMHVPFVMAAHWFMPVETIRRVGMFADIFPLYGNDDNYCHRVLYHGFKIGVVSNLKVVHDKEYSKQSKAYKIYRNYYMASLVELSDIRKSLCGRLLFVTALTFVKMVKYFSFKPLLFYFRILFKDLTKVRELRRVTHE